MRTDSPQHLSHGQADKWDTTGILLDANIITTGQQLDLPAIFGNTRPVELEIGCGKGTFLVARAASRPEANFVGVEYARSYAVYTADRVRRHGLPNVRMLAADASVLVRRCFQDESLWRVHIYFPDPWPKTRHHKRRLIQSAFVQHVRQSLKAGGQLLIVTDHRDYFEHIQRVLATAKGWATISFPQMSDYTGELVGTNFERKYIAQGRPFYSAALMKY